MTVFETEAIFYLRAIAIGVGLLVGVNAFRSLVDAKDRRRFWGLVAACLVLDSNCVAQTVVTHGSDYGYPLIDVEDLEEGDVMVAVISNAFIIADPVGMLAGGTEDWTLLQTLNVGLATGRSVLAYTVADAGGHIYDSALAQLPTSGVTWVVLRDVGNPEVWSGWKGTSANNVSSTTPAQEGVGLWIGNSNFIRPRRVR